MTLTISPVSIADSYSIDLYAEVLALVLANDAAGVPPATAAMIASWQLHPFPDRTIERMVAIDGGRPVGRLELTLFHEPTRANDMAVQLDVVPAARRQGVGSLLAEQASLRAAEVGRQRISARTSLTLPGLPAGDGEAGSAFASGLGLHRARLPEVMRRLDLPLHEAGRHLYQMCKELLAKCGGYRPVCWQDRTPAAFTDDVSILEARLSTDAPMGALASAAPALDADWLTAHEECLVARGQRSFNAGVMDRETERLVAWTLLTVDSRQPTHGWQQTTIVDPAHRGSRLGLIAKITNLQEVTHALAEIKAIDTFNATANTHMIAVNQALGMRPIHAFQHWLVDTGN